MLDGHRNGAVALKGQAPRQHFVQHHAGRINVRAGVDMLAPRLFRGDIMHGAEGILRHGLRRVLQAGNAEIGHLHAAVPQHHDVLGLNVPVNDAAAVGVLQGTHDLNDEVQGLPPVHLAPTRHVLLQGDAVNKLHDDVLRVAAGGHVINRHDVGMGKLRHGAALVLEAAADLLVLRHVRLQDLDGHHAVEPMALRLVNVGHSSGTDQLNDLVPIIQHFSYVLIHIVISFKCSV